MPPLSGFFGKMMILSGALESGLTWLVYLVILGTGLGMIVALTRTGSTVFYHIKEDEAQIDQSLPWRLYFPIFYLLALSAILVIWANPISQYTDQSAALLYDVGSYISEVLKEVD
jgi:multicomponent K+:H+ antiporter subunit D